ncbi:uncharacterized protein LOC126811923 [Patella vulgata]|uniref:uncharacterized protein LOC126811923 n=1 Tax=Patella vulgata TaxID=6465 RepID=UPI00218068EC|nr:uncharacterized protein LOC126811923 [Patella vulgata]
MLLSKIIKFLSSIILWVDKDVPTNTTHIMMCSNDNKTANTIYLYHAIDKSEENLKFLKNRCSCSISSDQPFTIHIKRHITLRSNRGQVLNKLTLKNGNQTHIFDLDHGINPFGTDCLYGSKDDCHMFNSTNNSLIIDLEESASFREFIFKIYGTEEIQIECNMTAKNKSVSQSKTQNKKKSQTEDQSQDEPNREALPILYIGIILILIAIITGVVFACAWITNPNLRHSIKRRKSKKNMFPEEKVINEEMSNAGSPDEDEDDKYEFCEIEENPNHGQKSDIQPPKIPSTPFPTKQLPFFKHDKPTPHSVVEIKDEYCHVNSNATNATMDSTQTRDNIQSDVTTAEEDPSYDHIESHVLKNLINTDDETPTWSDNNRSSIMKNVNEVEAGLQMDKFQSSETLDSVTAHHNDSGSMPHYYSVEEDKENTRDNYQYDKNARRETKSAYDLADHVPRAAAPIVNRSRSEETSLRMDKTMDYKDVVKEFKSLLKHDYEEVSLDETGCNTDTRYGDMIILENELYQSLDSYDANPTGLINNTPITHL